MDDFYATLGVPPNATAAEIKNRYRFLAHAYHPDKFSSDAHKRDAGEAFKKVNEAFQTLSDPSLRAGYDRQRASGSANEPKSSPPPPRPAPQPPPPRQPPPPTRSGGLSARTIVWLVIATGGGIAVLLDKSGPTKPSPDYSDLGKPVVAAGNPFAALDDKPADYSDLGVPVVAEPASSSKPSFDPTTAKPVFDPDAYLASKASPKTATSHGPREDYASQPATKERPFVNSLGMKFVPVLGTKTLFCVWETRVQDYAAFAQATGHAVEKPQFQQGPTHPVIASWDDAVAFCEWLSKKEGRTYRLPTDAEWSVAVGLSAESGATPEEKSKNGPRDTYPWGRQWPPPHRAGNYGQNLHVDDFEHTSPVGSFNANTFGLYDLSGNVWEWCDDHYYSNGDFRVERGGSWVNDLEWSLRSASRASAVPKVRTAACGFRCVLAVPDR